MALLPVPAEPPADPNAPAPASPASPAAPSLPAEGEPAGTIDWQEWSPAVFQRAAAENKLIFLMVDAPWARATSWIDQRVLTDSEVVRLVRELYIPVRVVRDRRPDIDLRYQVAVNVITKGDSGWPLLAMLAPTGELLYGTSFVAVEDRHNKPGLRSLLKGTATLYTRSPQASEGSRRVVNMAFERERQVVRPREIGGDVIGEVSSALVSSYDPEHGGFGAAPRLPTPFAIELAGTLYQRSRKTGYLDLVLGTLRGMEQGAIYDRVGGGIHRAASDQAWRYPEFEKLLSYNATFLLNCLMAFEASHDPLMKQMAERTLSYMLATLTDPEGGFYVSQHAVASGDDPPGLYYAWSDEELRAVVPPALEPLRQALFNITAEGDLMLGPPARGLLFLTRDRKQAASRAGLTEVELKEKEAALIAALEAARARRPAPAVDRSIYVDSCAWGVIAMLEAARVLESEPARAAGFRALDRMLAMVPADGPLRHRVAPPPDPSQDPALAMDHVMLAWASLAAHMMSFDDRYLVSAQDLMKRAHALFWDAQDGGFFDVVQDPAAPGYLSIRRRLPNDIAYPSLNALAARAMDRLALLTGESSWRDRADQTLRQIVSTMKQLEYFHSGLALAVESHLRQPTRYLVVGRKDDDEAGQMARAALRIFDPGKVVQWLDPERNEAELKRLRIRVPRRAVVVACDDAGCSEPVRDVALVSRPEGRR